MKQNDISNLLLFLSPTSARDDVIKMVKAEHEKKTELLYLQKQCIAETHTMQIQLLNQQMEVVDLQRKLLQRQLDARQEPNAHSLTQLCTLQILTMGRCFSPDPPGFSTI